MRWALRVLTWRLIKRYQAQASGIEELGQTAKLLNGQPIESGKMPAQIAFNAIPQIDTFQENGYTREEMKMAWKPARFCRIRYRRERLRAHTGFYGLMKRFTSKHGAVECG